MRALLLKDERLFAAVGAFLFAYLRAVLDVLLQGACHAALPVAYRFAVEAEAVHEIDDIHDGHSVAQHTGDEFRIVPELLVEQTRYAADDVRVAVLVLIAEIVPFLSVLLLYLDDESLVDGFGNVERVLLYLTGEYFVGVSVIDAHEGYPVLGTVLETHHVGLELNRTCQRRFVFVAVALLLLLLLGFVSTSTPAREPSR